MKIKKLLISLLLMIGVTITMAAEPLKDSACAPTSPAAIRMGTVGNDIWTYWWCRNSTDTWAIWNTWLADEWKSNIHYSSHSYISGNKQPYVSILQWAEPIPLNINGVPIGREHLWVAASAAIAADTGRPVPGTPNSLLPLEEVWIVTPNGSNPVRKTSKVTNGVVGPYGSGTQTVKIGAICDLTKPSYALGSLTKYRPLINNSAPSGVEEVISCIRIQ